MAKLGTSNPHRLNKQLIIAKARQFLHLYGSEAITANGISRALGATGPAIYRHFESVGELVDHVIGLVYSELCDQLEAAMRADRTEDPLLTAARELRNWSLTYPNEFALLFSSPITLQNSHDSNVAHIQGKRLGLLFLSEFQRLIQNDPRILERIPECPLALRDRVAGYVEWMGVDISPTGAFFFLETWVRIYGHITMEAMGQLSYALPDMSVLYERLLSEVSAKLNIVPQRS